MVKAHLLSFSARFLTRLCSNANGARPRSEERVSVVIPFPRRERPAASGLQVVARRDLRTGLPTAGVVRHWARGEAPVEALLTARALWRDAGQTPPLAIAPPPETYRDASASGELCATIVAAGFDPRSVDIEIDEAALADFGDVAGVERMRARGFGVVLVSDPGFSLALCRRMRSLFTELVMPAPSRLDPFIGVDLYEGAPMARRLLAARAAGIVATATHVGDAGWAKALAAVGFDRGEGAFAD